MTDFDKLFPGGIVNQNLIFITLFLAHIVAVVSLIVLYVYRKKRRSRRAGIIKDTIDALLEEHSLDEAASDQDNNNSLTNKPPADESAVNSAIDRLKLLPRPEFVGYIAQYFETAGYRAISLPEVPGNLSAPHMIIERNGRSAAVLTDQPKTNVTGLPAVKSYYAQNHQKLKPTDSLIIITTGSLSPKAIEFCRSLSRPIIIINGVQLANSIEQIDSTTS